MDVNVEGDERRRMGGISSTSFLPVPQESLRSVQKGWTMQRHGRTSGEECFVGVLAQKTNVACVEIKGFTATIGARRETRWSTNDEEEGRKKDRNERDGTICWLK